MSIPSPHATPSELAALALTGLVWIAWLAALPLGRLRARRLRLGFGTLTTLLALGFLRLGTGYRA